MERELDDQFNRRVRRYGNKHGTVYVHRLHVPGTVDDLVLDTLRAKEKAQVALFRGLLRLARHDERRLQVTDNRERIAEAVAAAEEVVRNLHYLNGLHLYGDAPSILTWQSSKLHSTFFESSAT